MGGFLLLSILFVIFSAALATRVLGGDARAARRHLVRVCAFYGASTACSCVLLTRPAHASQLCPAPFAPMRGAATTDAVR